MSTDHVTLSAGSPTATITPVGKNWLRGLVAGKTYTHGMYKIISDIATPDTSVATVDATGLVTRVAPGVAYVRTVSSDGAVGVCGVVSTATVTDSFNRANSAVALGNADTGQTWSALGGTWGISANQAYFVTGGTTNSLYAVVDSGLADTTVQVTIAVTDVTEEPRVVFRAVDVNNLWIVSTSGVVYKRVAGSYTSAATFTHTFVNGDIVSVVLLGNSITAKVNGTTVATVTDSFNATATKHGIGQLLLNTNVTRFDDFSVL